MEEQPWKNRQLSGGEEGFVKGDRSHPVLPALRLLAGLPARRDGTPGPGEIVVDFPGGSWYNGRRK